MANVNAPFGFAPIGRLDGSPMSGKLTVRKIANADSTAIYRGDPVASIATGYITRGAAGNTSHTITGIFMGCQYLSTAIGYTRWSPYWPGSGATGDITAYIVDDPMATFAVQSSGTAITLADIGANIDFTLGTGSTLTGQSGASADQGTLATTATHPFRVIDTITGVGPGSDAASSYNRIVVCWNDQFYRQLAGLLS